MDSMLLEQAQQISDALGPDDVSEGGLQLEELPPSSPSFLLETGGKGDGHVTSCSCLHWYVRVQIGSAGLQKPRSYPFFWRLAPDS
eukprot:1147809-Pelagomonas_calceolata.AAC.6